jgi:hypothetical protein
MVISPTNTAEIDSTADATVHPRWYLTALSGIAKPSIAMKCISQIATPPIAIAAMANQRIRSRASDAAAL